MPNKLKLVNVAILFISEFLKAYIDMYFDNISPLSCMHLQVRMFIKRFCPLICYFCLNSMPLILIYIASLLLLTRDCSWDRSPESCYSGQSILLRSEFFTAALSSCAHVGFQQCAFKKNVVISQGFVGKSQNLQKNSRH